MCVCVCKWCGEQNFSMMDREWRGHCCLSIHLRCTWKSSAMTAHPSDMGVQLSLLEQNQASALSIMHPFCSRRSYSCPLVLQNLAGSVGLMGALFARACILRCQYLHKNKMKKLLRAKDKRERAWGKNENVWRRCVCTVYDGGKRPRAR